jgi:hypothetical protein
MVVLTMLASLPQTISAHALAFPPRLLRTEMLILCARIGFRP